MHIGGWHIFLFEKPWQIYPRRGGGLRLLFGLKPRIVIDRDSVVFRFVLEILLVCSLIVETPAANLSLSEEATEDFKSTTSTWGSCCDKSAVVTAPC
jgi:hypothetical protein